MNSESSMRHGQSADAGFRATLDKRRSDISQMFDSVARRYDVTNAVLTFGLVSQWRKQVVAAIDPQPGQLILDLAAGTGLSARPLADAGAKVVPTDLSLGMLSTGKARQRDLDFVAADALVLPFADNSFDTTTISYGIRNVEHTLSALEEMRRVTKPGGRLVVCEFSRPTNPLFGHLYDRYLSGALRQISQLVGSNSPAYQYLADSIRAWPAQAGFAELLLQAGWKDIAWRNLAGGIVAVHRATA